MPYSDAVVEKMRSELERRRSEASYKQQAHRSEIELKYPEFGVLMRELAGTARELIHMVGIKDKTELASELDKLKRKNLSIQADIAKILEIGGYPSDYLREQYTCKFCNDTGVTTEGHICECAKQLLRKYAMENISASSPYVLTDFDSFDLNFYSKAQKNDGSDYEHMSKIFGYCKKYAEKFGTQRRSILMLGKTGLGKTHLSLAIVNEVTCKGYNALYDTFQNFAQMCENDKFRNGEGNTLDLMMECDLLVLDDVGSEFQTQFTNSLLYNVLNTRMLQCKPTIISTNLDLKELEQRYSGRIASRIFGDFDVLAFVGSDIRQLKKRMSK